MADASPLRAVLSGVTVTFGVITAHVDLVSAQQSKATRAKSNVSTTNLCPTCEENVALQSKLWCEHGHGPFSSDQTRKGIAVPAGELKEVSEEQVAAAKAPTAPARTADLSVFPAWQVESETLPNGNLFRLRSEATQTYGLLLALVGNRDHAFLCEMTVKGKTGLYRAIAQNGTIVLMELVRPERMLPIERVEAEVPARLVETAAQFVQGMVTDFVPGDWSDQRQARLAKLRNDLSEETPAATPAPDARKATRDLLSLLDTHAA